MTIEADTELDPSDDETLTITVSKDGSVLAERTLFAQLINEAEMSTASIASGSSSSGPSIMSAMSVVEDISTSARNPLSQTNPLTGTCLEGTIRTNDENDSW